MRQIEVDTEVYSALEARATGFGMTPNRVLRNLLDLDSPQPRSHPALPVAENEVLTFLGSTDFKRMRQAEDKYLALLALLYRCHKRDFASLASYGRGTRPYFATSEREIKAVAEYAGAKPIPETPYFAMTTLDNKNKAKVLAYALELFGYSRDTVQRVVAEFPTRSRKG